MLTKRGQRQAPPARVLELGLEWKVSLEKLSIWNMSIKTANLEESFFFLEESLFMPFIKFKCYQLHLLWLVWNIWKYQVIVLCTWNRYKLYLNLKIMKTALEKYSLFFHQRQDILDQIKNAMKGFIMWKSQRALDWPLLIPLLFLLFCVTIF